MRPGYPTASDVFDWRDAACFLRVRPIRGMSGRCRGLQAAAQWKRLVKTFTMRFRGNVADAMGRIMTIGSAPCPRHVRAFLRRRLVKAFTKRFRGNVTCATIVA